MKWLIFSRLLMQHYANCLICINHLIDLLMLIVKETRRGIWLPQFHMGRTEQWQRSLGHLGRTSKLKKLKDTKNIKRGLTNHLTNRPSKQIVKSCGTDGEIISQIIVVLPSIITGRIERYLTIVSDNLDISVKLKDIIFFLNYEKLHFWIIFPLIWSLC